MDRIGKAKPEEADAVQREALRWGAQFLDCGKNGLRGFDSKAIMPYMHVIMTHAARQISEVGSLNRFSGQALEKCNDQLKTGHNRQTNNQSIIESVFVQKRYESARRSKEIRILKKKADQIPRHTCQVLI